MPQAVDQRVVGQISDPWPDRAAVVVQHADQLLLEVEQLPRRLVERRLARVTCAMASQFGEGIIARGHGHRSVSSKVMEVTVFHG